MQIQMFIAYKQLLKKEEFQEETAPSINKDHR